MVTESHVTALRSALVAALCVANIAAQPLRGAPPIVAGPAEADVSEVATPLENDGGRSLSGCNYQLDDGSRENGLGVFAPGELGWLNRFTVRDGCEVIAAVRMTWGTANVPVPDGVPGRVFVWDDPDDDGNPSNAVLLAERNVLTSGSATNRVVRYALDQPVAVSGVFFVGASIRLPTGSLPASVDTTPPYAPGSSWVGYDDVAFNANNLLDNALAITEINAASAISGYFMVRGEAELGMTYQGRLLNQGVPANGPFDLRFTLFDDAAAGNVVGPVIDRPGVTVASGLFTVLLPFGVSLFDDGPRYLEVAVRSGPGAFTVLTPRQLLTPAPLAQHATSAERALRLAAPNDGPDDAVVVDASGRVGVGVAAPVANLHVAGDLAFGTADRDFRIREIGPNDPQGWSDLIGFTGIGIGSDTAGNRQMVMFTDGFPNERIFTVASSTDAGASWPARFSVLQDGRTGIGPRAPAMSLEVSGPNTYYGSPALGVDANTNWMYLHAPTTTSEGPSLIWGAPGDLRFGSEPLRGSGYSERMRITDTGEVGIGIAAPTARLHVRGGPPFRNAQVESSFPFGTWFNLGNTSTGAREWSLISTGESNSEGAGNLLIRDNTLLNVRFMIDVNGNVGVGTTSPKSRLDVEGAIRAAGVSTTPAQGAHLQWNRSNFDGETWLLNQRGLGPGGIRFGEVDPNNTVTERMRIAPNGNVGIGTASPAFRLQVAGGDLSLPTGFLRFSESANLTGRIITAWDLVFEKNFETVTTDNSWFRWLTNGVTIENLRILDGDEAAILGDGTFQSNGIDFAEAFKADAPDLEPGDIVSLAVGDWEYCRKSSAEYDAHLLGVVSTQPAFLAGMSFNAEEQADPDIAAERKAIREQLAAGRDTLNPQQRAALQLEEKQLTIALRERMKQIYRPIALAGRVPTKVDGRFGPIRAGDRLTSSPTPGHAMKQTQPGMSVGVAVEDFSAASTGSIMILVQPGWHGGAATAAPTVDSEFMQRRIELLEAQLQQLQEAVDELSR